MGDIADIYDAMNIRFNSMDDSLQDLHEKVNLIINILLEEFDKEIRIRT